jgi:UPF0176 protein
MTRLIVAAVNKFVKLGDCAAMRIPLHAQCEALGITGTLVLAEEGINGTIAEYPPFNRMKVKLKRKSSQLKS